MSIAINIEHRLDRGAVLLYTPSFQWEIAMRKPRVDKVCVICDAEFTVVSSRAKSAKTCSLECRGKLLAQGYEEKRVKLNCKACGSLFSVPKCHEVRRVYCSMKCADAHRNDKMPAGEESWNWQGGRTMHSGGYVYLTKPNHPYRSSNNYVFEHRLVMENELRSKSPGHPFLVMHDGVEYLNPEIHVHHLDEDKTHNEASNLLACTASAHRVIHNGDAPMFGHVWPEIEGLVSGMPYKLSVNCLTCDSEFEAKRSDVERGNGKYCSRSCYDKRDQEPFKVKFIQ